MNTTIRLHDKNDSGVLVFDLKEILAIVGRRGEPLSWKIRRLECVGNLEEVWPQGVLELEQQVAKAADGFPVEWRFLRELAERIEQTIDCLLQGTSEGNAVFIQIEAFDTTYWEITSSDRALIDDFAGRFETVERP